MRYLDHIPQIIVGTRIHLILYGGRDGTVFAIHGERGPEEVDGVTLPWVVFLAKRRKPIEDDVCRFRQPC